MPLSDPARIFIAAEKTGRRGYGIEIDPAYCDVAIRRLRAVCGLEAILEASGKSFAKLEAEPHRIATQ